MDMNLPEMCFYYLLNNKLGISDKEASCMQAGSMFNWEVPGAQLNNFLRDDIPSNVFVSRLLDMYLTGTDNVYEAYKAAYGATHSQSEGENDIDFIRRCAEQDYRDGEFEASVYQDVFDSIRDETQQVKTSESIDDGALLTGGIDSAKLFMQELLDSVETLSGIADMHGSHTLADLMYLQNAIMNNSFIDHSIGGSSVFQIARALPSGITWSKFIVFEQKLDNNNFTNCYDESYAKALQIGSAKQRCSPIDSDKNQRLEGSVLGVTSKHMVLSLGRSALICDLDDLDRTPKNDDKVVIVYAGGKGKIELANNKEIKSALSR